MDAEWWLMTEMSWQVNEEANRDKTGDADRMYLEVDSKDEVMHIKMSDLWFCRAMPRIARTLLSQDVRVRLSARLSVTRRYSDETAKLKGCL